MTKNNPLITSLKQAGLRTTPQRMAICALLNDTNEHPTAAAVYHSLKDEFPSLSLATVYNTLDALVSVGAVNALGHAGDDTVHYDAETSPHINLACISCHKIVDVLPEQASHLEDAITKASGYRLLGARILYYGLCPDCQSSKLSVNIGGIP